MNWQSLAYLSFGTALVVLFLWIIVHFYRPKRKGHVEEPKYKMLDDDQDQL
ncbi:MAG TPA: cbb3-type cytochrome c oxidase subunit 3 [Nitrospirae bacterium]|nr:cbb3-type cytochrome c oxidase subunit 3 [Nitrospirota bacterium]